METNVTVAAVQMPWKHVADRGELREHLYRYLRLAKTKGASLVILPELVGVLVALTHKPQDEPQPEAGGGLFGRFRRSGRSAEHRALSETLPQLVTNESDILSDAYLEVFGTAAREHGVWLVAGSLYVRNEGGPVRALSGVFDANGDLRGWQPKLHLADYERPLAVGGEQLTLFEAPWGRFGVLVGADILYPELGRALAYRGALAIANPAIAFAPAAWRRIRIAGQARAQENQIYVAQSFLLGEDQVTGQKKSFIGRSAIWAPVELAPRGEAPLVEVGTDSSEGVITTQWDFTALRHLWQTSDERPRECLRSSLFGRLLAPDFESGATIAERASAIETESAQRATRSRPVVLQSPSWPQRAALPPGPVPSAAPDDFLAGIEAEVEDIADLNSARELLDEAGVTPTPAAASADSPDETAPLDGEGTALQEEQVGHPGESHDDAQDVDGGEVPPPQAGEPPTPSDPTEQDGESSGASASRGE